VSILEIDLGSVVCSKAGRDKGKFFFVVALEQEYAYLVDGDTRKADRPKKKKLKHLQKTNYISDFISEKLRTIGKVTNSEVRKALAEYSERQGAVV
jgi:ribosomal protein L14E/L6E/L27E